MCDRLMTLPELCDLLQCKESWARDQLEARKWPITWVAGSYRFTSGDYQQILKILAEPTVQDRTRARRTKRRPMEMATASGKRPLKA